MNCSLPEEQLFSSRYYWTIIPLEEGKKKKKKKKNRKGTLQIEINVHAG